MVDAGRPARRCSARAPGQILFASDAPYGRHAISAVFQLAVALQVGLSPQQIRSIASEQSLRIAAGEPLVLRPAVGERERAPQCLLDRVSEFMMLGAIATMRGNDGGPEMLALARLACDVPDEVDDAPVFAAIRQLLDISIRRHRGPTDRRRFAFLILAANVARTPDVPVPALARLDRLDLDAGGGPASGRCAPRSAAARSA